MAPCRFCPEVTVKVAQGGPGGSVVADLKFTVQSERTPYVVDQETGVKRPVQLVAVCEDARAGASLERSESTLELPRASPYDPEQQARQREQQLDDLLMRWARAFSRLIQRRAAIVVLFERAFGVRLDDAATLRWHFLLSSMLILVS